VRGVSPSGLSRLYIVRDHGRDANDGCESTREGLGRNRKTEGISQNFDEEILIYVTSEGINRVDHDHDHGWERNGTRSTVASCGYGREKKEVSWISGTRQRCSCPTYPNCSIKRRKRKLVGWEIRLIDSFGLDLANGTSRRS